MNANKKREEETNFLKKIKELNENKNKLKNINIKSSKKITAHRNKIWKINKK